LRRRKEEKEKEGGGGGGLGDEGMQSKMVLLVFELRMSTSFKAELVKYL